MKKIMLFMAILIMATNVFSQVKTTQEEYNYVTKGLKAQYANGMDMKKGYTLVDFDKIQYSAVDIVYYYLLKKDNAIVAIISCFAKPITDPNVAIFCIPAFNSDNEIWQQYYISIYGTQNAKTPQYIIDLLKSNSYLLSKVLTSSDQMTTKK